MLTITYATERISKLALLQKRLFEMFPEAVLVERAPLLYWKIDNYVFRPVGCVVLRATP